MPSNIDSNELKNSNLLFNILFTLCLAVIVLYVIEVPHDIQKGINGQIAIEKLNRMREPLLDIKAVTSRFHIEENIAVAKSQLEKLGASAESCIHHYEDTANYNSILSKNVVDFSVAYNKWITAEKVYLNQFAQKQGNSQVHNHNSHDHFLSMKAFENNALFLSAMQLLADGESLIHEDLANGRRALQILLWTCALLMVYFFVIIVQFQRKSNREHAVREKNLEVTLRSIGDAIIATDIRGNVTRMNPEAERLTGWDFEDAKDNPLSEVFRVVSEHNGEPVDDLVEKIKREKGVVIMAEDSMLIASNGNRYQIHENGAPIYDDSGRIIGVVLVFRDITHSHELHSRLNDNTQRLKRVIDTSMDAVIVTDEQGIVKEWNPAAELMFGWSNEEIKRQPIHETIIPREFREQHLLGIKRIINSKQSPVQAKRIKSRALHRDGHTFPIELAMSSVRAEKGWIFSSFIRDLTDQEYQEYQEGIIEKNSVLLRESLRIANLGYWELDLIRGELEWSDEVFRIFGLDPVTTKASYSAFIDAVHPEDREKVDSAYSESLKNKAPYSMVHRITSNGAIKIVHEQCETTYDDGGKPVRSLGLIQDITDSVSQMDELRLAATMFRAHAGITVVNKNGRIVRVNPAFEEMTGYSSKELVGENPRIFHSGKQTKEFYKDMWEKVATDGMWQGELWNKRKDETLYAEWLTITAVQDDAGEVTHYVGTSQDITIRKQAESQIEYLAYHDDLTDLANRRLLYDRLHQSIAACRRHSEFGAVLVLDLDHFKNLNDALGYSVGDEILCQVASRLKELVREGDTVARLGGDEFVVVLSSVADDISKIGCKVQTIAEKIRMSLSQPYGHKGGQCYSNVSIGISLFPEKYEDIDDILKHADTALYQAKAQGRNTVCFYQPSMQVEVDERLAIGDGLRHALINNELILHYQPQVNDRGELIGAEALIRWEHPEQGMIPPDKFISIAEDTGLILDIGQWVLQEAARQAAEWYAAGICQQGIMRLAINVSPRQFRQRDFVPQVLRTFKQAGVSLDCIELEVTESLLMDDLDEVVEKMNVLRSRGIRISIDDFGTGYSSLAYLKQLPLDQLKVDQSFIRDITSDDNDAVVVETIIAMASHLDLSVIAEGVENQVQLDFLIEKGCTAFQGYYFSRPLSAEDFSCYIKEKGESCLPCKSPCAMSGKVNADDR